MGEARSRTPVYGISHGVIPSHELRLRLQGVTEWRARDKAQGIRRTPSCVLQSRCSAAVECGSARPIFAPPVANGHDRRPIGWRVATRPPPTSHQSPATTHPRRQGAALLSCELHYTQSLGLRNTETASTHQFVSYLNVFPRCGSTMSWRPCCRFQGDSPEIIAFSGSEYFDSCIS